MGSGNITFATSIEVVHFLKQVYSVKAQPQNLLVYGESRIMAIRQNRLLKIKKNLYFKVYRVKTDTISNKPTWLFIVTWEGSVYLSKNNNVSYFVDVLIRDLKIVTISICIWQLEIYPRHRHINCLLTVYFQII